MLAALPGLDPFRVWLGVGAIGLITLANLRGIRESGNIFAIPTYVFLLAMYALIGAGLYLLCVPVIPRQMAESRGKPVEAVEAG